jgi:hypothetical protein
MYENNKKYARTWRAWDFILFHYFSINKNDDNHSLIMYTYLRARAIPELELVCGVRGLILILPRSIILLLYTRTHSIFHLLPNVFVGSDGNHDLFVHFIRFCLHGVPCKRLFLLNNPVRTIRKNRCGIPVGSFPLLLRAITVIGQ